MEQQVLLMRNIKFLKLRIEYYKQLIDIARSLNKFISFQNPKKLFKILEDIMEDNEREKNE